MPDDENNIDPDEIEQILEGGGKNYEELTEKNFDAYDKLIKKIILIEKVHKYGSTSLDKKFKEIEKEIEIFINTGDSE